MDCRGDRRPRSAQLHNEISPSLRALVNISRGTVEPRSDIAYSEAGVSLPNLEIGGGVSVIALRMRASRRRSATTRRRRRRAPAAVVSHWTACGAEEHSAACRKSVSTPRLRPGGPISSFFRSSAARQVTCCFLQRLEDAAYEPRRGRTPSARPPGIRRASSRSDHRALVTLRFLERYDRDLPVHLEQVG